MIGIDYGFPVQTLDSRVKRLEQAVQRKSKGQVSDILDPLNKRFRTVNSKWVDRDGNIILPKITAVTQVANVSVAAPVSSTTVTTISTGLPSLIDCGSY